MKIICDTREKYPWQFDEKYVDEVIHRKVDTGDYAIEGLEQVLCIERKRNVQELVLNIRGDRFTRELERMQSYKHRFLICEFDLDDIRKYPVGSSIPKKELAKVRANGEWILKCITRLQVKYGLNVVYAGDVDNAIWIVTKIMLEVEKNERG